MSTNKYTCSECNKECLQEQLAYCSEEDGYLCNSCNDKFDEKERLREEALAELD